MMKLVVVALMCSAAVATSGKWVDLFTFPFTKAPLELMLGIACPNTTMCFICGSTGSSPVGVYYTTDEFKTLSEDIMHGAALLDMSMAFSTNTNGVMAGVGALKDSAIMYTVDSVNWYPSNDIALSTSQDVEVIAPNAYGFVGTTNALLNKDGVLYSNDGGAHWRAEDWKSTLHIPEGASARYGAFPSHDTWYVTGGSFPSSSSSSSTSSAADEEFQILGRTMKLNKKSKRLVLDIPASGAPELDNGYSAIIAKTTDGGKTWELQFNSTNEFYFNDIHCISETVCTAVGEGYADGTSPGGRIYTTVDGGKTWKLAYTATVPNAGMMLVRMISATEIWVAGSQAPSQLQTQVMMYHSTDGGNTWTVVSHFLEVGTVIGWSWVNNNQLAYATAVTVVSDSTILKYTA